MREEALVQQPPRSWPGGVADRSADVADRVPDQSIHGDVPRHAAVREASHQPLERIEHRVHHARSECAVPAVPVDEQAAVELGDLGVQQYLRPLRNDPHRVAEVPADRRAEQLTEIERAGEDHRGEHLLARAAGQLPQHLDTRVLGVGRVGVQARLHAPDAAGEVEAVGKVDLKQHRAGEVTDDLVDIGMGLLTVEQRDVEDEPRLCAPSPENLGERGRHSHRGGDSPAVGGPAQRLSRRGRQHEVPAGDAGLAAAGGAPRRPRKIRSAGHARQPVLPPLGGAAGGFAAGGHPGRPILAVAVAQDGLLLVGVLVEPGEIGEQDPIADRVSGHHVDVDVQPGTAAGQQAQRRREHLAMLDVEDLVRQLVA